VHDKKIFSTHLLTYLSLIWYRIFINSILIRIQDPDCILNICIPISRAFFHIQVVILQYFLLKCMFWQNSRNCHAQAQAISPKCVFRRKRKVLDFVLCIKTKLIFPLGCFWEFLSEKYLIQNSILGTK
jgi:hypothetical protein